MKKYIKTAVAALLCVAVLGLAGCGLKSDKDARFEPRLDTEKQVVLTVSGFFGNFEALDQVIADFNEFYPNTEIIYEQNGASNFEDYIKANSNIDLMMTSQEIFEKLGDMVNPICIDIEKEDISVNAIDKRMLSRGYHDGKLACIPIGQNIEGLVVNESLLEKEGLKLPNNYDEFISVLSALKEKGYTPIQGPNEKIYGELTQTMAYDLILSDKGLYEDLVAGKESAAEKLLPVYDKLNELIDKGFIDATVNEKYPEDNYDQAILNFFEGDVPFWVCNTEKVSGMKKRESKSEAFSNNPFKYTFIQAPLGEKGVYAYAEPWFGFSVNKNARNYDYAVEFLRFLATSNEINQMATVKGIPSVAVNSEDLDVYKNALKPKKVELDCVNEGKITWGMSEGWNKALRGYAAGEYATPQDALAVFLQRCSQ